MPDSTITKWDDVVRHDGRLAEVIGKYQAIARPRKGPPAPNAPADHAVVVLSDGTKVFLESLDSPNAKRSQKELQALDGKEVRVRGTCHQVMPSKGQGLIAPCINDISAIVATE